MGKPVSGKIFLSLIVAILMVAALAVLDRMIGPRIIQHRKNLVYGAYDKARMSSTEFDVIYHMNNLGFRGPNISLEKGDKERIVFIGDSFTFGWGVKEEDSWIGQLRKRHPNKELLNLGRGGDHPMNYVQQARKVLPILQPDKLIICLLQWNDLFQMQRVLDHENGKTEATFKPKSETEKTPILLKWYRSLFPNLSSVYTSSANIKNRWKQETTWILAQMNSTQKDTYQKLDPKVRLAFENYKLNPWILYEGVFHGNSYMQACTGKMDEALVRMSHHLLELETLADEHNCQLEILLLPYRPANCSACISDLQNLGYSFSNQENCAKTTMQESRLSGLISTSVHSFPSWEYAPDTVHTWYFPLDGHLTKKGNIQVGRWANRVLLQ